MIAFKHPYFLFAAFLIVIPIIVHLFNFRRYKKVYFSNVSWLEDIHQQTKKTSQIRHLLILFSRILVVLSLVIAFSGPFIPSKNKVYSKAIDENLISIYFDNSFSMNAEGKEGKLFDLARQKALEIIAAYNHSDKFHFINNDFNGKHQRLLTKDEIIEEIHHTTVSPTVKKISEVMKRQLNISKEYLEKYNSKFYLISDFQQSIVDLDNYKENKNIDIVLVPLEASLISNLYIDSCWIDVPVRLVGQTATMKLRVYNDSPNDYEKVPLRLFVNERQRAIASFSIQAYTFKNIELKYTIKESGIHNGYVEITDHPIIYDDRFYFSHFVQDKISVLSLNNKKKSTFLSSLFNNDSLISLINKNISLIDYASLNAHDLIILNELDKISSGLASELSAYLKEGGTLLLIPSITTNIENYNKFLSEVSTVIIKDIDTAKTIVKSINHTHELFDNVFEKMPNDIEYPKVFKHFKTKRPTKTTIESIITLQNGDDLLLYQPIWKGKLFMLTVPLIKSFSNFQNHSIFVPSLYKIAIIGQGLDNLYSVIGENTPIDIYKIKNLNQEDIKIKALSGHFEIIPDTKKSMFKYQIFIKNKISEAGNYLLTSGINNKKGLSFNYDRRESLLKYYNYNSLANIIEINNLHSISILKDNAVSVQQSIKELNEGKPLWKLFIIITLLFLLVEIALIKTKR